ncbi:uncharacterized protein [Diadema setosum]|uniref:uncharacterized protein n=1 Tax=Diadema setosum TaxID=31175 RepID=UPI003B3A71AC
MSALSGADRTSPTRTETSRACEYTTGNAYAQPVYIATFQLQKLKQEPDESTDNFLARCRTLAQRYQFKEGEIDDRLIEQLIIGASNRKVQEILLGKDDTLTLDTALDVARTQEATRLDMKSLNEKSLNLDVMRKKGHFQRQNGPTPEKKKCHFCGLSHPPRKCPAYGTKCKRCGKLNHWEACCRSKQSGQKQKAKRGGSYTSKAHKNAVHELQEETAPVDEFENLKFETITIDYVKNNEMFAEIRVDLGNRKGTLKAKADTGAQGNILPLPIYRQMHPNNIDAKGNPVKDTLKKCQTIITGYNKNVIPHLGVHTMNCRYRDRETASDFYVVDTDGPAILGLPLCTELQLIIINGGMEQQLSCPIQNEEHLRSLYPDRFEGIGNFKGEHHIVIDKEVPPVVHPPRRCPINIKDNIQTEIDQMVELGVITQVQEPTDWVSSLVYVQKPNGKWRICLDPRDLNKAIKRSHTSMPTIDETRHRFEGATVFSTMDAKHGYLSVKLDEESSRLTTFNSPFGRYRFKRLPFGLSASQDVFQTKMNQILEGCSGVICMADDIAVVGKTVEEHDANLHNLMRVASKHGLVFNWNKCRIKQESIRFYGLVFDKHGAHPDPQRVEAVQAIQAPTSQRELQEFLGIVTYMSPFISNLSSLTAPLRDLLKKDTTFAWSPSHQMVFEKTKAAICQDVTLAYFDPKKEVVLEVDDSSRGLGAALTQQGRPIAFASKSLTDTEQRYANIEREMLAVVYACEKFHSYIC